MNARNDIPLEDGLAMWERYNERLLQYHKKYKFPLINFDVSPEEYYSKIDAVAQMIGLSAELNTNEDPFYDDKLVTNKNMKDEIQSDSSTMKLYKALLHIYENQKL